MANPFLIDTCAAFWIVDGSISDAVQEALNASWHAGMPSYISPISAWEVGVLASRGRFKSPDPPSRWWGRLSSLPNVRVAELPSNVLMDSSFLPGSPPRDPADRILAATAREFGFTLLTRDRELLNYAKAGHLSALAC